MLHSCTALTHASILLLLDVGNTCLKGSVIDCCTLARSTTQPQSQAWRLILALKYWLPAQEMGASAVGTSTSSCRGSALEINLQERLAPSAVTHATLHP